MANIFFLNASDKSIHSLSEQLRARRFTVSHFDNLFEFKRRAAKDVPEVIFVADNLKEKRIEDIIQSLKKIENIDKIPVIGMVTGGSADA